MAAGALGMTSSHGNGCATVKYSSVLSWTGIALFTVQLVYVFLVAQVAAQTDSGHATSSFLCQPGVVNCSIGASCRPDNDSDAFVCVCEVGYAGNGMLCLEVDQCLSGTHACAAIGGVCTASGDETAGSRYSCSCAVGFTGDGRSCVDVDPCAVGMHNCTASGSLCLRASANCACDAGYTGDGFLCQDIDECQGSQHNCSSLGGACDNFLGGFSCRCRQGFSGDGLHCADMEECALGLHDCASIGGVCLERNGTFACSCSNGFSGDGQFCVDLDECSGQRGPHACVATCVNTMGSYLCQCNASSHQNHQALCAPDECTSGVHVCHGNAIKCIDLPYGYECRCARGFSLNDNGTVATCLDDNECMDPLRCPTNYTCFNLDGSYTCLCLNGLQIVPADSGPDGCQDVDECAASGPNRAQCDFAVEACRNTPGSYECVCRQGFARSSASHLCEDINECDTYRPACPVSSSCLNTEGSFRCVCDAGHIIINGSCKLVVPCGTTACPPGSVCVVAGPQMHSCVCQTGYQPRQGTCQNVDECAQRLHNCIDTAKSQCRDTDGSFTCPCRVGFKMDQVGGQCVDLDECEPSFPLGCDGNASCRNSDGSFHCSCRPGFTGSGRRGNCFNVNECQLGTDACSVSGGMICSDTTGSYRCDCHLGYHLDKHDSCITNMNLVEDWTPPHPPSSTTLSWVVTQFRNVNLRFYRVFIVNLGTGDEESLTNKILAVAPSIQFSPGGPNVVSYQEAIMQRSRGSAPRAYIAAQFESSVFNSEGMFILTVGMGPNPAQPEVPLAPLPSNQSFLMFFSASATANFSDMNAIFTSPYQPVQRTSEEEVGESKTQKLRVVLLSAGGGILALFLLALIALAYRRQNRVRSQSERSSLWIRCDMRRGRNSTNSLSQELEKTDKLNEGIQKTSWMV